ncbi:MAG: LptF/LptG family permease [Pikeienuella sp.]
MILSLHLSRSVLVRILAVMAALAGLALALDLVESASKVLGRDDGGILRYLMLRTPLILAAVAPVALIVGPVLTFLALSSRSEFTIYRASGITTYRVLLSLLPLAIVLGGLMFVMNDRVVPTMEGRLLTWLKAKNIASAGAFWAHTRNGVIRAQASSPRGDILVGLDVFETDPQGLLTARITARAARFEDGVWRLEGAQRLIPGKGAPTDASGNLWSTPLSPANVRALGAPGRKVGGDTAGKVLEGDWAGNRADSFYEMRVLRGYASVLAPALMILLAAPAAFGMRRTAGFGRSAAWAVALGFGYLLVDGMMSALGETGALPPVLAAFGATGIFSALGLWALVTLEE